jgi:hypothetical protein
VSRGLWLTVSGVAIRVVETDAARPLEDGDGLVGLPPDLDGGLDEVHAQRTWLDLQAQSLEDDGIVVADDAVLLMVSIPASASTLTRRSWTVANIRSERPLAPGE